MAFVGLVRRIGGRDQLRWPLEVPVARGTGDTRQRCGWARVHTPDLTFGDARPNPHRPGEAEGSLAVMTEVMVNGRRAWGREWLISADETVVDQPGDHLDVVEGHPTH